MPDGLCCLTLPDKPQDGENFRRLQAEYFDSIEFSTLI
jgi:hypothetical protein